MKELDLLWNLDECNRLLDKYKKELDKLNYEYNIRVENYNKEVVDLNEKHEELETYLRENINKLRVLNKDLKNLNYEKKAITQELYEGMITDIVQLDYLTQEESRIIELGDKLELQILFLMDEIEAMESQQNKVKMVIEELNMENYKLINDYNELKKTLKENILKEETIINIKIQSIDIGLLNKYNELRNNKNNAIILVESNICSGCNMFIPTSIADKLKKNLEIQYCESCGRILYGGSYQKEKVL